MRAILILAVSILVGGSITNNVLAKSGAEASAQKAPVILGHRIGPGGAEMLVVKP